MKITKEEFDKLYSEDITKKEYDSIVSKIDARFEEICSKIIPKRPRMWFDYGNCDYDSEDSNGYFDIVEYESEINVGGAYADLPNFLYDNQFPTRWLWEDFESEFDLMRQEREKELNQEKLDKKEKAEKLKLKKVEMKNLIQSKLTKEELKFIKFK